MEEQAAALVQGGRDVAELVGGVGVGECVAGDGSFFVRGGSCNHRRPHVCTEFNKAGERFPGRKHLSVDGVWA